MGQWARALLLLLLLLPTVMAQLLQARAWLQGLLGEVRGQACAQVVAAAAKMVAVVVVLLLLQSGLQAGWQAQAPWPACVRVQLQAWIGKTAGRHGRGWSYLRESYTLAGMLLGTRCCASSTCRIYGCPVQHLGSVRR